MALARTFALLLISTIVACRPPQQGQLAPAVPVEVTVSQPLQRQITDAIEGTGTTAALESVEVRARVTGFLQSMHYKPSTPPKFVKAGDLLFTIDQRPFQIALDSAKAELEARKAELLKAEFDATKVEGLMDRGASNEDERIMTVSRRDSLRAAVAKAKADVDRAQLDLGYCSVTAPISGRVGRNLIDPGNIVGADSTVLAVITNDQEIYAYFDASERDVLMLRSRGRHEGGKDPAVQAPVFLALMTDSDYPYVGYIDYCAPGLDPDTGTIQVRAKFENVNNSLLPGLFVRVKVPTSHPYDALTVTERALAFDQGQRFLLTVNAQNIVEFRPVQIGTLSDGLRVVVTGITSTDWVIVNGLQRVRPGVTVKPVQTPMPVNVALAGVAPAADSPADPEADSIGAANSPNP